jgi:hypothetical protein
MLLAPGARFGPHLGSMWTPLVWYESSRAAELLLSKAGSGLGLGAPEAMPFHHMHLHKFTATVITALADHITKQVAASTAVARNITLRSHLHVDKHGQGARRVCILPMLPDVVVGPACSM